MKTKLNITFGTSLLVSTLSCLLLKQIYVMVHFQKRKKENKGTCHLKSIYNTGDLH